MAKAPQFRAIVGIGVVGAVMRLGWGSGVEEGSEGVAAEVRERLPEGGVRRLVHLTDHRPARGGGSLPSRDPTVLGQHGIRRAWNPSRACVISAPTPSRIVEGTIMTRVEADIMDFRGSGAKLRPSGLN